MDTMNTTWIYASLFAPILIFAVVGFRKGVPFTVLSLLIFNISYQIAVVATPFVYVLLVSILPFLAAHSYPYVYVVLLGSLFFGGVRLTTLAINKTAGSVRLMVISNFLLFIKERLDAPPSRVSSVFGVVAGLVWGLLVTVSVFYLITLYFGV